LREHIEEEEVVPALIPESDITFVTQS